jgi:hypothetical protein
VPSPPMALPMVSAPPPPPPPMALDGGPGFWEIGDGLLDD